MRRPFEPLLIAALFACAPDPATDRDAGADAAPPSPSATLEPLSRAEIQGKAVAIGARSDVPLVDTPVIHVGKGDWMLKSDHAVAVISAEQGRVIALGSVGHRSALEAFAPAAFDALDDLPGETTSLGPAVDGGALRLVRRLYGKPLDIEAWFGLHGDTLLMRWQLHARGAVAAVTMGELVYWGNAPTWVEGHGFVSKGGSYSGAFLAWESLGLSYAYCREGGRVTARFRSPELAGFHRSARTGEQVIALGQGESSPLRSVALSLSRGALGVAMTALPCAPRTKSIAPPKNRQFVANAKIEVAHCESEAAWQARLLREPDTSGADAPGRASLARRERGPGAPFTMYGWPNESIAVPDDCARMRIVAAGHAPGAWIDPAKNDEQGWSHPGIAPRAGRIAWQVRDPEGAVLPATLVVRGEHGTADPDWGEDGADGAARNYLYTTADGSRPLPPGRYRAMVHRGFEHTLHDQPVTVRQDETVKVAAVLERVVDTRGWISADLHVHALPSPDAPTLLEDRVRSLAAVGVEVAVATDHNAVTDYGPVIVALGLERHLASLIGDEVTTDAPLVGHFNVFPLAPDALPLAFRGAAPKALFEAARRAAPDGVLQVNHPRMGNIGYFELFRFDRGAVDSWVAEATLAEMKFDAVEVFNGDHYADHDEIEHVLRDWYALLDAGRRYTATGNSDSHKIAYQDAGVPRNYVALDTDDPARFDTAAFVRAVREGRVVVSSGPFIALSIGGAGPGGSAPPGELTVSIRVDAPPWIDLTEVELLRRAEVVKRWSVRGHGKPRFDEQLSITAADGDWLLCVARGKRPMAALYRKDAKPLAFTNPIWIRQRAP